MADYRKDLEEILKCYYEWIGMRDNVCDAFTAAKHVPRLVRALREALGFTFCEWCRASGPRSRCRACRTLRQSIWEDAKR